MVTIAISDNVMCISSLWKVFVLVYTCYMVNMVNGETTVISYNIGGYESIGNGVIEEPPSRADRRDAIINQLKSSDADVICLQEAYIGEDVYEIVQGLSSEYPYSFSPLHDRSGNVRLNGMDRRPACNSFLYDVLTSCIASKCPTDDRDATLSCIASKCAFYFVLQSQECWTCNIITWPGIEEVREECGRNRFRSSFRKMNNVGLLLLSKTKLNDPEYVDYHRHTRELKVNGYLRAEVENIGQVGCTHNTPYSQQQYLEFELLLKLNGIQDYVTQGRNEIKQLVRAFSEAEELILMGDFNVGPKIPPNITETQPDNYALLTDAFQTEPLQECTFCKSPENGYNSPETPDEVIDHIFYEGYTLLSSERIFDNVTVDGLPLSDHFGIKQTFTRA